MADKDETLPEPEPDAYIGYTPSKRLGQRIGVLTTLTYHRAFPDDVPLYTASTLREAIKERDMWKGQCERQARKLEGLHMAIADHNADCINQCDERKKIGKSSCYVIGYGKRQCHDCPRDAMFDLAAIDAARKESSDGQ